MTDDQLIARHITPHPYKDGDEYAVTKNGGVSVWALVGYWRLAGEDISQVSEDYDLPPDVIKAALAYYRRHQTRIDILIEDHAA
jgi:uncharacterized protein (DUF433 family)